MSIIRFLVVCLMLTSGSLYGQKYVGKVLDKKSGMPVEFVNIGIVGKNVGTVSRVDGTYELQIDSLFDNDNLMVSCIGYNSITVKVADFKMRKDLNFRMEERVVELEQVVIRPRVFKQGLLGITTRSKIVQAGFKDNQLGYECGVLMKVKKSALLQKVNINISQCTYDTIFYRLNIYHKVEGSIEFENILKEPIYLNLPKNKVGETVVVDLKSRNITVEGDFLVTLEHVKDLGLGNLFFNAGLSGKTYYRKTSQGKWETAPVGIGISVEAQVEK